MFGGFGFGGFRDDIIIDNGFGMGMGMGRQVIIENNGFGRGQEVIIQNRGFFGRQQEIIVNNGYGMGGSTTIIQNRGLFGPRQEIIVNNNGYGMGGSTTIIQNRGFFGPRQEIIINNGGFGGNQIIVCQPGCMKVCCAYKTNQIIVCQPGCMKVCCAQKKNQYFQVVEPVVTGQLIFNQSVMQQPLDCSPYTTNNYFNQQQVQNIPPQVLFQLPLLQLKYEKWVGPRNYQLTRAGFDRYGLASIRKIKCRTNHQPFSNYLENGQIIMKVVVGLTDVFFAAKSSILRDYFVNSALLKIRWNGSFNFHSSTYLGEIEGRILKKSDFLGNWEQRYIKITKIQGLMSFRNPSHNHTLHVKSTRQLWSWFEVINGKFLVIKIKHNLKKLEFGIPLNQCQVWLQAFFGLLETYQ